MIDPSTLFRGDTTRVVFYPDPKRHKGPATVESMELRHLFVQDDMVLRALSYDHPRHRPEASHDPKALKKTLYTAPDFDIPNPKFESAYYILRSDGRYARGRLFTDPPAFQKYRSLILHADRVP